MTVEGADTEAGARGDVVHLRLDAPLGERLGGGGQDPSSVAGLIRALRLGPEPAGARSGFGRCGQVDALAPTPATRPGRLTHRRDMTWLFTELLDKRNCSSVS